MVKYRKSEQLYRKGEKKISTSDRTLAIVINDYLLELAKTVVIRCPKLKPVVQRLLKLADSEAFRTKVPVIAYQLCDEGEWAYLGGRDRSANPDTEEGSSDPPAELRQTMNKVRPYVEPSDLIQNGWRLAFDDLEGKRKRAKKDRSKLAQVMTSEDFIDEFTEKMINHLKTLAQRHANVHAPVELTDVDHISGDPRTRHYDENNVVFMNPEAAIDTRKLFRKVENVLRGHQKHHTTIKRWFFQYLTPAEETVKFGVPTNEVYQNRDAAMKWLRTRLAHLKDES